VDCASFGSVRFGGARRTGRRETRVDVAIVGTTVEKQVMISRDDENRAARKDLRTRARDATDGTESTRIHE
jgi:hypothetical protein